MLNMELNKNFTVAGIRWTVLEKLENGYLAIADSIGDKRFGYNNDWKESSIRKMLNTEFAEKLEKELGVELPEFERDLLSLDGSKEYGTCMDKVSLISVDEYRKYRDKLPNTGDRWWTLTPDSTRCNDDSQWIRVVSPSGYVDDNRCDCGRGVRPICIFPSSIFESMEKLANYEELEEQPRTNADRIRTMTNEQLAEFLCEFEACNLCEQKNGGSCSTKNCNEIGLTEKWLKEEVK